MLLGIVFGEIIQLQCRDPCLDAQSGLMKYLGRQPTGIAHLLNLFAVFNMNHALLLEKFGLSLEKKDIQREPATLFI